MSDTGAKKLVYQRRKKADQSGSTSHRAVTQMDAVVSQIAGYCRSQGIRKLPDVFCPALPEIIPYQFRETLIPNHFTGHVVETDLMIQKPSGLLADIGWYDDPDHQLQSVYTLDLCQRHVLIVGSSRIGKTNALETIIRDLAFRYTPEQLHIYIADYASRALTYMEDLPHVGGVVCSSDREKTESLFRMLMQELERRKSQMAKSGTGAPVIPDFSDIADIPHVPHILLVIDHLSALKELIFQDDPRLLALCSEGLQAGIHVVAANPLASSVGFRYLSAFGEKIALHCNDSNEYHYLFDHPREVPKEHPGSFLIQSSGIIYHGQCYRAFEDGAQQIVDMIHRKYHYVINGPGDRAGRNYPDYMEQPKLMEQSKYRIPPIHLPKPIPQVPEILTDQDMKQYDIRYSYDHHNDSDHGERKEISLSTGITMSDIIPYVLDLSSLGALLLTGTRGSGRHNWIRWMDHFLQQHYQGQYQYYIADGIYRKLGWLAHGEATKMYSADPKEAEKIVLQVETILKERYERLLRPEGAPVEEDTKLLIIMIDSAEALETISHSPEALSAWRGITGRYKSLYVCPIIAGVENAPISFQAPEILRDLRDMKNCLFFGDLKAFRLFEIPYTVLKQATASGKPGEAWHICGADCTAIKTPLVSTSQ